MTGNPSRIVGVRVMAPVALLCAVVAGIANMEVTRHPSDQEAIVGGSVSLSCEASGGQFDQWLHNDQPVSSEGDYRMTSSATGSTLEITSFREEQAGEYRCQFSSDCGSILSLPGKVKYFGSLHFDEHPRDFDSYVLDPTADGLIKKYREVIALQCTFQYDPYIVRPVITWQRCHDNGSYEDVKPTTQYFSVVSINIPTYEFFQTNRTGYFQIIASNDSIYDGSRFRCKASSSIPGDNQEVYSNCARITQHPPDVVVPSNLSIFSTIPKRMIHLVDGETGIMACSIQRKTDSHAPEIRTPSGETILRNSFLFNAGRAYDFIHELNLKINTSQLDRFDTLDFVCAVEINGMETPHPTRFTWHHPIEALNDTLQSFSVDEGNSLNLTFRFAGNSITNGVKLFKDGVSVALNGSSYEYEFQPNTDGEDHHIIKFEKVAEDDDGVFQFEVENFAGSAVQYYYLDVILKARSLTPHQTITKKVTETVTFACEASFNEGDAYVNFTWTVGMGDIITKTVSTGSLIGLTATSEHTVTDVTFTDTLFTCQPTNRLGSYNSTQFTLVVEKFSPPEVLNATFNHTAVNHMTVTWLPIDLQGYNNAYIGGYLIELHVLDEDGAMIDSQTSNVSGSRNMVQFDTSAYFSNVYQVRVKAFGGDRNVSDFGPWYGATRPPSTVVVVNRAEGFPGWAIFLIVLFILLLILLLMILVCLCVFCREKIKDKGEYDAEKREAQYNKESQA